MIIRAATADGQRRRPLIGSIDSRGCARRAPISKATTASLLSPSAHRLWLTAGRPRVLGKTTHCRLGNKQGGVQLGIQPRQTLDACPEVQQRALLDGAERRRGAKRRRAVSGKQLCGSRAAFRDLGIASGFSCVANLVGERFRRGLATTGFSRVNCGPRTWENPT